MVDTAVIRPAVPEDARAIAEVDVASWRAAYRSQMPAEYLAGLSVEERASSWELDIAKHGSEGRKRWLVAEVDASIAGYALAGIPTGATRGMLFLLYTLPETWGTGVGLALHAASMTAFEELGVREASLCVLEQNSRARRFYEREGWTPSGARGEDDYGEARLAVVEYSTKVMHPLGA